MSFHWPITPGSFKLVASTNTALINGTPTMISYTVPNDGMYHPVIVAGFLNVTIIEVGGAITLTCMGSSVILFNSAKTVAMYTIFDGIPGTILVQSANTITIAQTAALTSGAAGVAIQLYSQ
jgi:hypothetical protein